MLDGVLGMAPFAMGARAHTEQDVAHLARQRGGREGFLQVRHAGIKDTMLEDCVIRIARHEEWR